MRSAAFIFRPLNKRTSARHPPSPCANTVTRGRSLVSALLIFGFANKSIARLIPIIGATPNSRHALAKRIAPDKPSRSVRASAGDSNCAARSTRSRGWVVPYLSEKALDVRRWIKLIPVSNLLYDPRTCDLIAFEFKGLERTDWRSFNCP